MSKFKTLNQIFKEEAMLWKCTKSEVSDWIKFREKEYISKEDLSNWLHKEFGLSQSVAYLLELEDD
jgi:hypothetical protein